MYVKFWLVFAAYSRLYAKFITSYHESCMTRISWRACWCLLNLLSGCENLILKLPFSRPRNVLHLTESPHNFNWTIKNYSRITLQLSLNQDFVSAPGYTECNTCSLTSQTQAILSRVVNINQALGSSSTRRRIMADLGRKILGLRVQCWSPKSNWLSGFMYRWLDRSITGSYLHWTGPMFK